MKAVTMVSRTLDKATVAGMVAALRKAPLAFEVDGSSPTGWKIVHRATGTEVFRSMPGRGHHLVRMADNLFS
jgi:hypothetical protein